MKIVIIALGTRGDVEPYLALGAGLRKTGNAVGLFTHRNFAAAARANDLEFYPAAGDVQELLETSEMRELLERGNFLAISRKTSAEAERAAIRWAQDGLEACRAADLLITGIGGLFAARSLAEKLDLPLIEAFVVPFTPTGAFAGALIPSAFGKLGAAINKLSHRLVRQAMWQGFRRADNRARREVLNLPSAPFLGRLAKNNGRKMPTLYGFSPSVIPKPFDWGENVHVTGYWFSEIESEWQPPADLKKFLDEGEPPVCIGFGSMSSRQPAATARLILDALASAKQRAVVLSGWSGLETENLPDTIFAAAAIPHSWLFERVRAVVHHGGAGTTAAGFRAGVPTVVVPFFGDQFFWGAKAWELGVGVKPIPRKKLTAEKLADALRRTLGDEKMRQSARELGDKIRREDGASQAAQIINETDCFRLIKT